MEGASVKLNGFYTIWQKLSEKIEVGTEGKKIVSSSSRHPSNSSNEDGRKEINGNDLHTRYN